MESHGNESAAIHVEHQSQINNYDYLNYTTCKANIRREVANGGHSVDCDHFSEEYVKRLASKGFYAYTCSSRYAKERGRVYKWVGWGDNK